MVKNIGGELDVGLAPEFCSKKIPRNRFGTVFVFSAEESAHFESFEGPRKNQFRSSERNSAKKLALQYSQSNLTK